MPIEHNIQIEEGRYVELVNRERYFEGMYENTVRMLAKISALTKPDDIVEYVNSKLKEFNISLTEDGRGDHIWNSSGNIPMYWSFRDSKTISNLF